MQCQQKAPKEAFQFKKKESLRGPTASATIDLENKGIGPIEEVRLGKELDHELADRGKVIYEEYCTACHKVGTTFIGPPPNGILLRRTPEWVMNLMLNTEEMLQEDSLAKALFMEFDGQLMTNQGLNQEEARAILEYFRALD